VKTSQEQTDLVSEQVIEQFALEGFSETGDQTWKLIGESAHIQATGDVFIERNVVLTLEGQAQVFTDKVLWQNDKKRFMTNQPVQVKHEEVELNGIGALGKMEEKFIQINQNIRMTVKSGALVTCRGPMKFFQDEDKITLHRDVWILDDRGSVSSDRMHAYFEPKSREIERVIAEGHVRVTHDEDVTYADKAVYDVRNGSVKLEGAPDINIRNVHKLKKEYEGKYK
jgi:lipopolysaccharide assembly outer membrane protein LptD (OstA)